MLRGFLFGVTLAVLSSNKKVQVGLWMEHDTKVGGR